MGIETVLRHPSIFRARECARGPVEGLSSGFASWDRLLGGGWPSGQLLEGCGDAFGGETRLLLPALAEITRQGRQVALVTPPAHPWLPAWEALGIDRSKLLIIDAHRPPDRVWALEQLLQDASVGGVVSWLPQVDGVGLRRLRLACSESAAFCWALRPESALERPSAAHLRYTWTHDAHGLAVRVLKQAGRVGDSDWVRVDLSRSGAPNAAKPQSKRRAAQSASAASRRLDSGAGVGAVASEVGNGPSSSEFLSGAWRRFRDIRLEAVLPLQPEYELQPFQAGWKLSNPNPIES